MHKHHIAAYLLMLCSLSLAACGGGGGGGGSAAIPPPTGGMPIAPPTTEMPPTDMPTTGMPPVMSETSYGTYANWNRAIETAFASTDHMTCRSGCERFLPAQTDPIRSPFGETAAFDPSADRWAALWTGPVEGYSDNDPDGAGPQVNRWEGTAHLQIRSGSRSTVRFWTPDANHYLESGEPGSRGPTNVPDTRNNAWTATLSRAAGEKGFFSGTNFTGQFAEAPAGTTPSSAIGHIESVAHTGVFEVSRTDP